MLLKGWRKNGKEKNLHWIQTFSTKSGVSSTSLHIQKSEPNKIHFSARIIVKKYTEGMHRLSSVTLHKFSTNLSTKNPPVCFANHFPNHILCRIWRTICHIVDESNSSLEAGRGRPKDCRHRLSSWLPAALSPCKFPYGSHSLLSHKHTRILTSLLLHPTVGRKCNFHIWSQLLMS